VTQVVELLLGQPETVSWCPASSQEKLPEQMCLEEATKCDQWFCWCHVFREVIPGLRAGDRKSSATNSRKSADIPGDWCHIEQTRRFMTRSKICRE